MGQVVEFKQERARRRAALEAEARRVLVRMSDAELRAFLRAKGVAPRK